MMTLLSAEWLKTKRTAVRWLTFAMPAVVAAMVTGYVALRGADRRTPALVFQIFFESWAAWIIPLCAGFLSGYMAHQEETAGHFTGFLGSKAARHRLYGSKFGLLVLSMTASTFIATVMLGMGIYLFERVTIEWPVFLAASILVMTGTVPILALHLWASFRWGMGASIGMGIGGLLLAALMGATSLGDRIWPFIPWAWPVRLAVLPGAYLQYTAEMSSPPEAISSGYVLHQLATGLAAASVCLALALAGGLVWFNRWEGRRTYE